MKHKIIFSHIAVCLICFICIFGCNKKDNNKVEVGLSEPLHSTEEVIQCLFKETGLEREKYSFSNFSYDYVNGRWLIVLRPTNKLNLPAAPGLFNYIIENKETLHVVTIMEG